MIIEQALVEQLEAIATVKAIVADRIHWGKRPHGDENEPGNAGLPCIVLHRISTERDRDLSGPNGLCTARFQVDSLAIELVDAALLADEIRKYLIDAHTTWGSVVVQSAWVDGDRDLPSDAIEAEAISVAGRQQDLEVMFEETDAA